MDFRFPLSTIFSFWVLSTFAQYPYPKQEQAQKVKDRVLAVQLLKSESEVEVALNQVIKEAFSTVYEGKVEYFSPSQLEKVQRKQPDQYTFLKQPETLHDDIRFDISYVDGSYHQWILGGADDHDLLATQTVKDFSYQNISLEYYQFVLYVIDGKREKEVTAVTFANGKLGKHDYIFLAQQLNILINSSAQETMRADFVNVEQNVELIKSSECFFLRDYFAAESLEQFDDYYEHPYELVNFSKYLDLIQGKTQNATYIKIIFSFQHNKYMWIIVNATDGRILSLNDIGDYKFTGTFAATELIKPRHLKYSVNVDTQLLNNYYNK